MNKLTIFIISLAIFAFFSSCEENKNVVDPGQPEVTPTGAVTPVASTEGAAVTATIGPAGGTIESADKRIKVDIPAGALSAQQVITVQPLSKNHCPLGTGTAFRLAPHGIEFAKPARITFQYTQQDVTGSAPELLRIAYQTGKGHWQSPRTKSIDTTAHTVSVQTTHFSDWGMFQTMHIYPNESFLDPGEKIALNVYHIEADNDDDELTVPLGTLLPAKYVEKWTLQGEGTLTNKHNTGTYQAPARIPAVNPTAVTVFLNKSVTIDGRVYKDIRLVANFFVAPEGISMQYGNNEWVTFQGGANLLTDHRVVAGKLGSEHIQVLWVGPATGQFSWTLQTVTFLYNRSSTYLCQHIVPKDRISGGTLRVNNDHPEYFVGTFYLTSAGWIDMSTHPPSFGEIVVRGVIRVKRV
jgi:hypothetical protein